MIALIVISLSAYLVVGAIIGGVLDDKKNESITDGILCDKKLGVWTCVFMWPLLIVLFLLITILNMAYLFGKKIRLKLRCIDGIFKLD